MVWASSDGFINGLTPVCTKIFDFDQNSDRNPSEILKSLKSISDLVNMHSQVRTLLSNFFRKSEFGIIIVGDHLYIMLGHRGRGGSENGNFPLLCVVNNLNSPKKPLRNILMVPWWYSGLYVITSVSQIGTKLKKMNR